MPDDPKPTCPECAKKDAQIADLRAQIRALLRPVDYKLDTPLSKPAGKA